MHHEALQGTQEKVQHKEAARAQQQGMRRMRAENFSKWLAGTVMGCIAAAAAAVGDSAALPVESGSQNFADGTASHLHCPCTLLLLAGKAAAGANAPCSAKHTPSFLTCCGV